MCRLRQLYWCNQLDIARASVFTPGARAGLGRWPRCPSQAQLIRAAEPRGEILVQEAACATPAVAAADRVLPCSKPIRLRPREGSWAACPARRRGRTRRLAACQRKMVRRSSQPGAPRHPPQQQIPAACRLIIQATMIASDLPERSPQSSAVRYADTRSVMLAPISDRSPKLHR